MNALRLSQSAAGYPGQIFRSCSMGPISAIFRRQSASVAWGPVTNVPLTFVPYHPAATPRRVASSASTWRDNSIVIKNSDQVTVVPTAAPCKDARFGANELRSVPASWKGQPPYAAVLGARAPCALFAAKSMAGAKDIYIHISGLPPCTPWPQPHVGCVPRKCF